MSIKRKIATIATASVIALSVATGAIAQQSTVNQEIQVNPNGVLTASISNASMTSVPFSLNTQTSTGNLVLNVEDSRGSNAGWSVTMRAQNFAPQQGISGAQPIPASGFRYLDKTAITGTPGDAGQLQSGNANTPLDNGHTILSARNGTGTGKFTMNFNTDLAIPAAQPAGLYQSTVTVQTGAAPGQ